MTIYGVHAVLAWLTTEPRRLRRVSYEGRAGARLRSVVEAAAAAGVAAEAVDGDALRRLAGPVRHQGVVAEATPFPYADVAGLFAQAPDLLVAADQIQDPQNLGAILRTADAVGAGGVLIPRQGAASVTAAVEVAAAGAAASMPVGRVVNLARTLDEARRHDYWIVGLETRGGENAFEFDPPGRVVVVVGGETGIRPGVDRRCDVRLSIPMWGRVESLNASVAAAVALFSIRHRLHRAGKGLDRGAGVD